MRQLQIKYCFILQQSEKRLDYCINTIRKKKKDKRELLTSEEKDTTSTNSWILNEISSK